ncbi:MAG TPA: replication-relaxation family protein [candidate division Zixibacteria bacterium]|nr:replication-relaxation family protein [candidate division Zixibacteria bacterium]
MRIRQRPYIRKTKPPTFRLTRRDRHILETIHAFDGILSLKQIERLYFSGSRGTWPRERLRGLFHNGYLNMPDPANIHRVPLGETIYFLGEKGAAFVAGLRGEVLRNFPWRRQPRWSLISHDLAVNNFRIDVIDATQASHFLSLHHWTPESEFWAYPDKVEYRTASGTTRKRRVIPDGLFTIRRPDAVRPGVTEELAFLLEIDMGTEDNPRFAREKVRPGVAYLKSQAYKKRFGIDYGRWLVVTTSQKRLENMAAQAERAGGSELFYFITFDSVSAETTLTQPIWRLVGSENNRSLVPTSHIQYPGQTGQLTATMPLAAGMRFSVG